MKRKRSILPVVVGFLTCPRDVLGSQLGKPLRDLWRTAFGLAVVAEDLVRITESLGCGFQDFQRIARRRFVKTSSARNEAAVIINVDDEPFSVVGHDWRIPARSGWVPIGASFVTSSAWPREEAPRILAELSQGTFRMTAELYRDALARLDASA